ncbi:N-acetyltransferase family protein [Kordia sp.]|uniref:GNAT family N-acetyltransferase n=1 Tax=Kordia sp. TaxID=1965332 RepID=UPI003D2A39C3
MKFEPKICTTKSDKKIEIRLAKITDAQAILNLKRGYIENTTTLPLTLDEYPNDINKETKLIKDYEVSENSIFLVAVYEGQLIGNIDLTGSKRKKMFHTGMIGMGINKNWRNQGLGKILIENTLDWAKNHSKIEIVWLNVYASNNLGVHLYKNMGFIVSGIIKDFFKDENGYIDKIQMYQKIK